MPARTSRRPINLIRGYVYAYVRRHGRAKAAADPGVSHQTLWRFLERGHMGRSPSAPSWPHGPFITANLNPRRQDARTGHYRPRIG